MTTTSFEFRNEVSFYLSIAALVVKVKGTLYDAFGTQSELEESIDVKETLSYPP